MLRGRIFREFNEGSYDNDMVDGIKNKMNG